MLWLGGSVLFFMLLSLFQNRTEKDESEYFFKKEIALLNYDFTIADNKMTVCYIDGTGKQDTTLDMPYKITGMRSLQLVNNQIRTGRQVTNTSDRKLKPLLVNGNEIIYLSDKNRGIGFYTLRKISLITD
jgi:hypothetical protein